MGCRQTSYPLRIAFTLYEFPIKIVIIIINTMITYKYYTLVYIKQQMVEILFKLFIIIKNNVHYRLAI